MADYVDTKVSNLVINNLTQEKYDELLASGQINPDELYCTPARELTSVATDDTMTGDGTPENPLSVADALASKADDNAVMHLSGDEVVDGAKIFTGNVRAAYNSADAFQGFLRGQADHMLIASANSATSEWNPYKISVYADHANFGGVSTLSMPTNYYNTLTLGSSGSTYTAPADGWYFLSKKASAVSQYASMINTTSAGVSAENNAQHGTALIRLLVPVRKGDKVQINYNLGGTTNAFRFVYVQGSKWVVA